MEDRIDNNIEKKQSKKGAIIVIVFGIIFTICIIYVVASFLGTSSDKSKLEKYLKENNYTESGGCWTKDVADGDDSKFTRKIKYCLSECKYYSESNTVHDIFVFDMSTLDVNYEFSSWTYKYKYSSATESCFFNGKEIAKSDYTCKLVTGLAVKHLKTFNEVVVDKLNVNLNNLCY